MPVFVPSKLLGSFQQQLCLGSDSHVYGTEQKEAGGFEKRFLPFSVEENKMCSHVWIISWRYRTIFRLRIG